MKFATTTALFVMALSVSVMAWAEESTGGNTEPTSDQTEESTTTKPDKQPEPSTSSAEPGCSD